MTGLAALFLTLATTAGASAQTLVPVPSGDRVWLQETLSDTVVGMGLVQRYRFVMPALADQVPPIEIPAEGSYVPDVIPEDLTDEDMAALNDGSLTGIPADDLPVGGGDGLGDGPAIQVLPMDTPAIDHDHAAGTGELIPDEAFDVPVAAPPTGSEAAADADIAVPAAPDILMQDPNHADIVWLCENYVLPRIKDLPKRPQQIVISLASAESPFGTFDPAVVQLFEGFALPADRDVCLWEPW